MSGLTPAQLKTLNHNLFVARNDWQYIVEPLRVKSASVETLRASAQRALWLTLTETCSQFGLVVPDYKDATGLLRNTVDNHAAEAVQQLAKAA